VSLIARLRRAGVTQLGLVTQPTGEAASPAAAGSATGTPPASAPSGTRTERPPEGHR